MKLSECASSGLPLRQHCQGVVPLDARLEQWMVDLLDEQNPTIYQTLAKYGSPVNFLQPTILERNVQLLQSVGAEHDIDLGIYFARKANKCLSFVDAALNQGAGVDVASEQELKQVLARNVPPEKIICTAAIKTQALLKLCLEHNVVVVVDNHIELSRLVHLASAEDYRPIIAIRFGGFLHRDAKLFSRFGFDVTEAEKLFCQTLGEIDVDKASVVGLHFHLDGYDAQQRVSAISQSLHIIDLMRERGYRPKFLDMGGGFPMSYIDANSQWDAFWTAHQEAIQGGRPSLTFQGHGLGLSEIDSRIVGTKRVYPFYQSPVRDEFLSSILQSESDLQTTIASALKSREIELRCEPGRSLLDGCGFTVATVEFKKRHHSGEWFIGLAMNRTQCRTSSDDFLVDPILLPFGKGDRGESMSGYLVGAYCTESELLCLRKLTFSGGVAVGDLVAFPNTAGYFMHFLESRSHQFPLAKNLVISGTRSTKLTLDDVDK